MEQRDDLYCRECSEHIRDKVHHPADLCVGCHEPREHHEFIPGGEPWWLEPDPYERADDYNVWEEEQVFQDNEGGEW
jgi:hypothetical protein